MTRAQISMGVANHRTSLASLSSPYPRTTGSVCSSGGVWFPGSEQGKAFAHVSGQLPSQGAAVLHTLRAVQGTTGFQPVAYRRRFPPPEVKEEGVTVVVV